MARLGKPVEGFDIDWSANALDQLDAQDAKLKALGPNVIHFGVADGCASYLVQSEKPLVLRHIPHGDAYQIPYAHIRGLTLRDVRAMLPD